MVVVLGAGAAGGVGVGAVPHRAVAVVQGPGGVGLPGAGPRARGGGLVDGHGAGQGVTPGAARRVVGAPAVLGPIGAGVSVQGLDLRGGGTAHGGERPRRRLGTPRGGALPGRIRHVVILSTEVWTGGGGGGVGGGF